MRKGASDWSVLRQKSFEGLKVMVNAVFNADATILLRGEMVRVLPIAGEQAEQCCSCGRQFIAGRFALQKFEGELWVYLCPDCYPASNRLLGLYTFIADEIASFTLDGSCLDRRIQRIMEGLQSKLCSS